MMQLFSYSFRIKEISRGHLIQYKRYKDISKISSLEIVKYNSTVEIRLKNYTKEFYSKEKHEF